MADSKQGGEVFLVVISNLPRMLLNLLTSYLHMKQQAKLAGKEFYHALVDNGMPPKMAHKLTDEYSSMFNITTLLKDMGGEK